MKKAKVLPAFTNKQLSALAKEYDGKLIEAISGFSKNVTEIGKILAAMRDESMCLYRFVYDPRQESAVFETWRDYARYRIGKLSDASLYDYVSAHSLTQGEHALSESTVNKLGIKKAAQLSRLPPELRMELLPSAQNASVASVKRSVDSILDEGKPKDEKKERLLPISRSLPQQTIDLIEEIEHDGIWMEGIRDGDKTLSLKAKLWHAIFLNFKANFQAELDAGAIYREEQANANTEGAAVSENQPTV
jgi:hypothetical protein